MKGGVPPWYRLDTERTPDLRRRSMTVRSMPAQQRRMRTEKEEEARDVVSVW